MWFARWFQVISVSRAEELGLMQHKNLKDFERVVMGCKMIYIDQKGREYRVAKHTYDPNLN